MDLIDKFLKLSDRIEDKNINVDLLVPRPQLIVYVDPSAIQSIKKNGLSIPKGDLLIAYPALVPDDGVAGSSVEGKTPIKISILKLDKSTDEFYIHLLYGEEQEKITKDDVSKLCEKPELFQGFVKKVGLDKSPKFGIQCVTDFTIPSFAIKFPD